MKKIENIRRIVVSRTDSIGDVCLTLPICKSIKEYYPNTTIIFLGKSYTKDVIMSCPYVDEFLDFSFLEMQSSSDAVKEIKAIRADCILHVFPNKKIATWSKKAAIPHRIGTSHRFFHWFTCTTRLDFTRKNSQYHEAELNFELLKPLDIPRPDFQEIKKWKILESRAPLPDFLKTQLGPSRKIVLHCKSQGSAVEWGLDNFFQLAMRLADAGLQVFFTGTEAEGRLFRPGLPNHPRIIDVSGKMLLDELMTFIQACDVLVAASTGPLHLAGLLGTKAIGLFSPRRPIHPGRWQPLGEQSITLVKDPNCKICIQGKPCACIENIDVETVFENCL